MNLQNTVGCDGFVFDWEFKNIVFWKSWGNKGWKYFVTPIGFFYQRDWHASVGGKKCQYFSHFHLRHWRIDFTDIRIRKIQKKVWNRRNPWYNHLTAWKCWFLWQSILDRVTKKRDENFPNNWKYSIFCPSCFIRRNY